MVFFCSPLPTLCLFMTLLSTFPLRRALRPPSSWQNSVKNTRFISFMSSSNEVPLDHLKVPNSHITPYWLAQLQALERPIARQLISQLTPENALGFDPLKGTANDREDAEDLPKGKKLGLGARSGTLLNYTILQKQKHSDKIILIRSGEFYETYGIDALMLINYSGLNPMGNKAKAGCPVRNVQATLDDLTNAGLSVAVFEENGEVDAPSSSSASKAPKIKSRSLTQIVSPASSTYIHDLCLRDDDIDFHENRPAIGLLKGVQGYLLVQVYLDEEKVAIYERLTVEGVQSLLSMSGFIAPIYVQNVAESDLTALFASAQMSSSSNSINANGPFSSTVKMSGYTEQQFPSQVLARLAHTLEIKHISSFRMYNPQQQLQQPQHLVSSEDLPPPQSQQRRPRPIYTSTALQIGLLPNDNVPRLVPQLLPKVHSALSARYGLSLDLMRVCLHSSYKMRELR